MCEDEIKGWVGIVISMQDNPPAILCSWECAAAYSLGCCCEGAPGEVNGVSFEEDMMRVNTLAKLIVEWLGLYTGWVKEETL